MRMDIIYRPAALEQIIGLRHAVLRPGLPADTARFAEDADPRTRHFAAFAGEQTVACVTYIPSTSNGADAWQLRAMAVHAGYRGRGIGAALLRVAEAQLLQSAPPHLIWCNARSPAVPFYVKQGWRVVSEEFEIPVSGPHFRLEKRLGR